MSTKPELKPKKLLVKSTKSNLKAKTAAAPLIAQPILLEPPMQALYLIAYAYSIDGEIVREQAMLNSNPKLIDLLQKDIFSFKPYNPLSFAIPLRKQ